MFGLFKKKDPKERVAALTTAIVALDNGLKNVENFWEVGSAQEGDLLLTSIVDFGMRGLVGSDAGLSEDLKRAKFQALQDLLIFLERHRRRDQLHRVVKAIGKSTAHFNLDQLSFLKHYMDILLESVEANVEAKEVTSEMRLVYYACQKCGRLNLICTKPCVYCGFASITERDLRRSLLLGSYVLETPALLGLAREIESGTVRNPRGPTFEQLWPGNDLDTDAMTHTARFNAELPGMLAASQRNVDAFSGSPNVIVKCPNCQKNCGIFTHETVQRCLSCSTVIPVPHLRRLKATLKDMLWWVSSFAVHHEGVPYANFIASFVLLSDYALRRDQPPTVAQGRELIDRFASLGTLDFNEGNFSVRVESSRLIGTVSPTCQSDEEFIDYFREYVMSMNNLFTMITSKELSS